MRVLRGGEPIPLPASRKTRALLAYLVLTGREHARDRLCSLLWPDVDDPRGALRWSLSRLRPVACSDGRGRLVATRETVRFDAGGADVDALSVMRLLARDAAHVSTAALAEAAASFRGPALEGLDLPDAPDFHGWCIRERERFRSLERDVLDLLVDRLRDDPESALPYAERRASLDLQDDPAHARLVTILGAAGRVREGDAHFRARRRWLEGHGGRPGPDLVRAWAALSSAPPRPHADDRDMPPAQEVRFCRSRDGVPIAYAIAGRGPPLVKAANWLTSSTSGRARSGATGCGSSAAITVSSVTISGRTGSPTGRRRTSRSRRSSTTSMPSSPPQASADTRCSGSRKAASSRSPTRCGIPS